jgi:RNA polymerase sigma-70 factor (ECF subfamily)
MDERRLGRDERERAWRAWMIAAQAGDAHVYERLLLELLPHARRQVARSVADRAAQEDVVQNALVSLHRARHTYRPERPFGAWFHAIVRNAVIDWARARGRRLRREVPLDGDGAPEPSVDPASGAETLSPQLERALAALPAAQREAVELIHLEGLSVAEAAARAGVSRAALKVRAHRGYRALRVLLGERDP